MDRDLKALAEVGLALTAAEEALDEDAAQAAVARLDEAELGLAALRAAWPAMGAGQRRVVGAAAPPLRAAPGRRPPARPAAARAGEDRARARRRAGARPGRGAVGAQPTVAAGAGSGRPAPAPRRACARWASASTTAGTIASAVIASAHQ